MLMPPGKASPSIQQRKVSCVLRNLCEWSRFPQDSSLLPPGLRCAHFLLSLPNKCRHGRLDRLWGLPAKRQPRTSDAVPRHTWRETSTSRRPACRDPCFPCAWLASSSLPQSLLMLPSHAHSADRHRSESPWRGTRGLHHPCPSPSPCGLRQSRPGSTELSLANR